MKRLRLEKWTGQLTGTRPSQAASVLSCHLRPCRPESWRVSRRHQSSAAASDIIYEDPEATEPATPSIADSRAPESTAPFPSPLPEKALSSAKLAALHARLSLSERIPLQTLARTLVDASADENPRFNNSNLAFLGHTIINYHISEWLMCRYPRLPMSIVYAAIAAYASHRPLHEVARQWGIESAAVPGDEVDPGLLQFSMYKPGVTMKKWGYERAEAAYLEKYKWRRGINSRVVLDDDFGDTVAREPAEDGTNQHELSMASWPNADNRKVAEVAHAHFVRAVVGAIYAHCGREPAKSFVKAHILSRTLDFSSLFSFKMPTRELAMLCARENFEKPVARLLSETGRLSRTPVFVVGIYSGKDRLGEGAGANLDAARWKAAMNALKAWYLYSPGERVRVPSDMLVEDAKPWEPVHIDIGEII